MKVIVGLKDQRTSLKIKGKLLTGSSTISLEKDDEVVKYMNAGILDFKMIDTSIKEPGELLCEILQPPKTKGSIKRKRK
jgi:hypothetical protein